MIATLFTCVDTTDAQHAAQEFAVRHSANVTIHPGPLSVADAEAIRSAASPAHLQVVCVDGVSAAATTRLLALVRSGTVVGYSTRIWQAPGIAVTRSGLRSDDDVYVTLTQQHGLTGPEAAQAARIGRGSADAGAQALGSLADRTRIFQLLDSVRSHDFSGALAAAESFTHADIALLRSALWEIESEDYALWTPQQVELLARHADFVAATVSDYRVTFPQASARMLAAGLYFAECGTAA